LRVDENGEDDIQSLVIEMLDRLDDRYIQTVEEAELQKQFFSFFRPGHFGYGATSRIGSAFLRRYRELVYG
jgi:hypothetical protein